jgi:hypothetical protein
VIPAYDAGCGELCRHTRLRFLYWCQANGARPLEMARLGQRLTALAFNRRRMRVSERLEWIYEVPECFRASAATQSSLSTNS